MNPKVLKVVLTTIQTLLENLKGKDALPVKQESADGLGEEYSVATVSYRLSISKLLGGGYELMLYGKQNQVLDDIRVDSRFHTDLYESVDQTFLLMRSKKHESDKVLKTMHRELKKQLP